MTSTSPDKCSHHLTLKYLHLACIKEKEKHICINHLLRARRLSDIWAEFDVFLRFFLSPPMKKSIWGQGRREHKACQEPPTPAEEEVRPLRLAFNSDSTRSHLRRARRVLIRCKVRQVYSFLALTRYSHDDNAGRWAPDGLLDILNVSYHRDITRSHFPSL